MKYLLIFIFTFISTLSFSAVKLSDLPVGTASTSNGNDSFPYVNSVTVETERLLFADIVNIPSLQTKFLSMIPVQTSNSGKCLKTNGTITSWLACASYSLTDASSTPIYTIGGSPATTTGAFTMTLSNESANTIFAGPSTGSATQPTFRSLIGSDLPLPSASTIGGIQSKAAVANSFLYDISTSGVVSTRIIIGADLPLPSSSSLGGVQSKALVTNNFLTQISTSGVVSAAQPSCSNLSGVAASCSTDTTNASNISSGTLAVARGGTGIGSGTSGGIPYYSGSTTIASSAALDANKIVLGGGAGATPVSLGSLGTTTTLLHGNASGAPSFGAVSLTADVSGILPSANGGTGGFKTVGVSINSGTSIGYQVGGTWISSLTNNSSGDFTLNLTGSFFSSSPTCTCTVVNNSNPNSRLCKFESVSASSIRIFTATYLDIAAAENSMIICIGPG